MDQHPGRAACFFLALLALVPPAFGCGGGDTSVGFRTPPPFIALADFQPASIVIGQPDAMSAMPNRGGATAANSLFDPGGAAVGSLYVCDCINHRILGFDPVPSTPDPSADFVIGQTDFATATSGIGSGKFNSPRHIGTGGGRLAVADTGNNRVLLWSPLPTSNVTASVVVGQADFVSFGTGTSATTMDSPLGVWLAGGKLIVSEQGNHRVLVYDPVPTTNGAAASLVLGQANFAGGTANRGGAAAADTLDDPAGVWSDGTRLVVADVGNARVLIWNTFPTSNGQAADVVLGKPDFTTIGGTTGADGMSGPTGVASNGTQLFVHCGNSRILVWNAFPTMNGQPADVILGQANDTNFVPNDDDGDNLSDAAPTARTLSHNTFSNVAVSGNRLFVLDAGNHRVLIFIGL
jgi:hypothetical protein